jgi:hypothetical protein
MFSILNFKSTYAAIGTRGDALSCIQGIYIDLHMPALHICILLFKKPTFPDAFSAKPLLKWN